MLVLFCCGYLHMLHLLGKLCKLTSKLWLCTDTALALFFVEYMVSLYDYWQASFKRPVIKIEFKGEPVLPGFHKFSLCLVYFIRT